MIPREGSMTEIKICGTIANSRGGSDNITIILIEI